MNSGFPAGARSLRGQRAVVIGRGAAAMLAVTVLLGCAPKPLEEARSEEPLAVLTSIDGPTVTIGSRPTYRIDIEYRDGLEVSLPVIREEIGGLAVASSGGESAAVRGNRRRLSRWFTLRADEAGSFILPAIDVVARPSRRESGSDSDRSEPETGAAVGEPVNATGAEIFLDVVSTLPEDGSVADIRGVKPIREVERGIPWWIWLIAATVLAIALGWWWSRRRARAESVETTAPPELSPHDWAFAELARLRQTDFAEVEQLRTYYFELSGVVRTYVERRFALNATDLTTEEIVESTRRIAGIDTPLQRRLTGVLRATDIVKYAAQVPAVEEIEETYEAALDFVEQTIPAEEPPADTALAQDGATVAPVQSLGQPPTDAARTIAAAQGEAKPMAASAANSDCSGSGDPESGDSETEHEV